MGTSRYRIGPGGILSLACFAAPLACVPSWENGFALPQFAALSFFTLAAAVWAFRDGRMRATALDFPAGVFLAVLLLSTYQSMDWRLSLLGLDRVYLFGAAAAGLLAAAFWLGAACAEDLEAWGRAALACAALMSLGAFLQAMGAGPFTALSENPLQRYGSLAGNPVSLGAFLAAAMPWSLHFAMKEGKARRAAAAAGLLCAAALYFSGSRAAWLAAAGACAVWLALSSKKHGMWAAVVLALGLAVLAGRSTGPSDRARLDGWRIAAAELKDRPVLGSGPDTYVYAFRRLKRLETARTHSFSAAHEHAHNDWLQWAATTGLAGLAAYFWLHAAALGSLKTSRGPGLAAAASLAALFLQSKVNAPGLPAAWFGALCLGGICAGAGKKTSPLRLRLLAAAAVILPACALTAAVRSARAEAAGAAGLSFRAGGRMREAAEFLERAIALDPDTPRRRFHLANLLFDAASAAGPEARSLMLQRAVRLGVEGALRHPLDADLHRLIAVAELRRYSADPGRLPAARAALDAAWMLDRHNSKTAPLRAYAAYLAGDRETLEEHSPFLNELWSAGHWRLDPKYDCREIALRRSEEIEREVLPSAWPQAPGKPAGLPPAFWHLAVRLGPPRPDLACPNLSE